VLGLQLSQGYRSNLVTLSMKITQICFLIRVRISNYLLEGKNSLADKKYITMFGRIQCLVSSYICIFSAKLSWLNKIWWILQTKTKFVVFNSVNPARLSRRLWKSLKWERYHDQFMYDPKRFCAYRPCQIVFITLRM
jgi:hypothetical protein